MSECMFQPGVNVRLHGQRYEIEDNNADAGVKLRDWSRDIAICYAENELRTFLAKGQLEFTDSGSDSGEHQQKKTRKLPADVNLLSEAQRMSAHRRYAYVQAVRRKALPSGSKQGLVPLINEVAIKINDDAPPAWTTVYRWCRADRLADGDIRAQVENHAGKGNCTPRIQPEILRLITEGVDKHYLTMARQSISSTLNRINETIAEENRFRDPADLLKPVCYHTLWAHINKIDPYVKMLRRYGKNMAERMFRDYQSGPKATRPLEIVEIDHTKLDLFVIDDDYFVPMGRPTLTIAVDRCTRSILGFFISFHPASYLSVMECLKHAILPKDWINERYPSVKNVWRCYGKPSLVVVDNGKEFQSSHFEDACRQIGIKDILYAPRRKAWFKGVVERYFRTINTQLLHSQPGATFGGIFSPEDYDPAKNATISFQALLEIVHIWAIDIYQQHYHRSICGSPAKLWDELVKQYPPNHARSRRELDIFLGYTEERTIQKNGIEWEWLFYNSKELADLRRHLQAGMKVRFKYDPNDISFIHVNNPLDHTWLCVPANDQEYTRNRTFWQHQVVQAYLRKQGRLSINVEDLCEAAAKIRMIVRCEKERYKNRKKIIGERIARFENVTQPSPSTTSVLPAGIVTAADPPIATGASTAAAAKSPWEGVSGFDSLSAPDSAREPGAGNISPDVLHRTMDVVDTTDFLDDLYSPFAGWGYDYSLRKEKGQSP